MPLAAAELAASTRPAPPARPAAGSGRGAGQPRQAGYRGAARRDSRPVVPQEQLLEGRRLADQAAHADAGQPPQQGVERVGVDVEAQRCRRRCRSCTPGSAARPSGGAGELGLRSTVRVRCRSSVSVPVSTVRPSRMMRHPVAQRLDLGQDVAGQQHRAAPRALLARCTPGTPPPSAGPGPRSARPAAAARRRRRARRPGRPSAGCPWSRRGAFLVGSSSKRSSRSARRRGSSPPRSRPSRSIDLAAGEVGPQRDVAGHVGEPPVQGGGVAPRVAAEQPHRRRRRRAAARAAPGCVVDLPAPLGPRKPWTSPVATLRSSPSRARVDPNVLVRPSTAMTGPRSWMPVAPPEVAAVVVMLPTVRCVQNFVKVPNHE